jgi:hypothetical protein
MAVRQLSKAPYDADDKATIVSIYPVKIIERKPGLFPGVFTVEPGYANAPSILVVGPSHWELPLYQDNRAVEMTVSAIRVARSIVDDYTKSVFAYANDSMPGLFALKDAHTADDILKNYQKDILEAAKKQKSWYEKIIKSADVMWARTDGNPLAIPNDARLAAEQLGLADGKAWMQDFKTLQMVDCPACGSPRKGNFPVCSNCRTILDPKKYKEMGLAVAG